MLADSNRDIIRILSILGSPHVPKLKKTRTQIGEATFAVGEKKPIPGRPGAFHFPKLSKDGTMFYSAANEGNRRFNSHTIVFKDQNDQECFGQIAKFGVVGTTYVAKIAKLKADGKFESGQWMRISDIVCQAVAVKIKGVTTCSKFVGPFNDTLM